VRLQLLSSKGRRQGADSLLSWARFHALCSSCVNGSMLLGKRSLYGRSIRHRTFRQVQTSCPNAAPLRSHTICFCPLPFALCLLPGCLSTIQRIGLGKPSYVFGVNAGVGKESLQLPQPEHAGCLHLLPLKLSLLSLPTTNPRLLKPRWVKPPEGQIAVRF
jgi:hypothetical protein